jgi:hypothetical protein
MQADLVPGRSVHNNSWTYRQRRHRHNSHDHPIRSCVFGVHAQCYAVLVRDTLQHLQRPLCCQNDLWLLILLIQMFPLSSQLETSATYGWLILATPTMAWLKTTIKYR